MLCPDRCPPTFGRGPACPSASPRVPPGGKTTPSLSWARPMKLRPFSGIWTTSRFPMTSLISALPVCRSGAVASTVTCWERPSRPSENSRVSVRPISRTIALVSGAKPLSVAVTSHCPMRSAGRKNRPSPSVTRSTTVPLAGCVAATVAPASTPPEVSRTTPPISPEFVWAAAVDTVASRIRLRTAAIMVQLSMQKQATLHDPHRDVRIL